MNFVELFVVLLLARDKQPPPRSPFDQYVDAARQAPSGAPVAPGSTYVANGRLGDLARDLRAAAPGDLVTIVVSDRAAATQTGSTNSSRTSSAKTKVQALLGVPSPVGALPNAVTLDSTQQLQGDGETSRSNTLNTSLSARVVEVLPNGYLVLEGAKEVQVNSERQLVTVRGVARWNDVSATNTIRSDRLAQMELRINGKGVVGDAIRRPNILYRILLGLLPF
jgi:flagellar L-ring protein precursor FlgH